MGHHIDEHGQFQSDKYPALGPDKVVLDLTEWQTWDGLLLVAGMYEKDDPELAADIEQRVKQLIEADRCDYNFGPEWPCRWEPGHEGPHEAYLHHDDGSFARKVTDEPLTEAEERRRIHVARARRDADSRPSTDELIDLAEQLTDGPPPAWDSMLETLEGFIGDHEEARENEGEDGRAEIEVLVQMFHMLRSLIEGRGHVAGLAQARADFREELRQADGIRQEGEDQLRALISRAAIAKAVEDRFTQAQALSDRLFARVAEHREMLEGTGDGLHAKRLDTLEAWMPRFLRRLDGLQRQIQPEGSPQPNRPDGDHYIPDPLEVAAKDVVARWHEQGLGTDAPVNEFAVAMGELEKLLEAGS